MCLSMPKMPEPEKMPDPAPAPPPPVDAPAPTPAPELVNADSKAPKVAAPKTKRSQQQQAARGTNALKIPMNTGTAGKKGGLNIPT